MTEKVMIKVRDRNNYLFNAIVSYMDSEKIDYIVEDSLLKTTINITKVIYIDDEGSIAIEPLVKRNIPLILISDKKKIINDYSNVNYIITNLLHDNANYTEVQKEYLFKKGIYRIFLEKLSELLENSNNYSGMIYDLTELKKAPDNWIFSFDSINDTYNWLLKKNKMLPNNFVRKVVNFYSEKVYDDSLREINYLTAKLMEIKEGKNVIDMFICSKEELDFFKKNYFFKLLIKNLSATYKLYIIDKDKLFLNDKEIVSKLRDGIAIYDDCVYRDTYDDEFSLGYVDCNQNTIKEYNEYFDYVLSKYGTEIKMESDLNEF